MSGADTPSERREKASRGEPSLTFTFRLRCVKHVSNGPRWM